MSLDVRSSEMAPPELESVESFIESLLEDDRLDFTFEEAETLAASLEVHVSTVIRAMRDDWGMPMQPRASERRVRGIHTSSHDRWFGPGSSKTHGGSGHEQIAGWAGQRG